MRRLSVNVRTSFFGAGDLIDGAGRGGGEDIRRRGAVQALPGPCEQGDAETPFGLANAMGEGGLGDPQAIGGSGHGTGFGQGGEHQKVADIEVRLHVDICIKFI